MSIDDLQKNIKNNNSEKSGIPYFSENDVIRLAKKLYGKTVSACLLVSYADQNFLLMDKLGEKFVFKISNYKEDKEILEAQVEVLNYLSRQNKETMYPSVCLTKSGEQISIVKSKEGKIHFIRMLTFLEGDFLTNIHPHTPELLQSLGVFLGNLDKTLTSFSHPATHREFVWNLKNALKIMKYIRYTANPQKRNMMEHFLFQFETNVLPVLPLLRTGIIHNDANDYNLLVGNTPLNSNQIIGIIDFGDMIHSPIICELAIAMAYAMFNKNDPIKEIAHVVRGYNQVFPLMEQELEILFYLICARLCTSVCMSAYWYKIEPDNEYLKASEKPAWKLLEKLAGVNPIYAHNTFRDACKMPPLPGTMDSNYENILNIRHKHIGKVFSIHYKKPLKIEKGGMQYLFDNVGRSYLDAVNNVCHVGHCHPKVVKAAQKQIATLNTNTRYLHDKLGEYAQLLCSTFPEPLKVCFFVCTGSEANDLALRLARTHTKQQDIIVVDGAYHGNNTSVIEISPYKFNGPGGMGAAPYIHKVVTPDLYRGEYKAGDTNAGEKYAKHVQKTIEKLKDNKKKIAAFFCESLLGCGGQIVLPENYLKQTYQYVRNAGGVCIADEVHVGFGRIGSHFWGFETQGVVPDIVTLGKPIGNGHPLAAVITTPEFASSFNNGMEYFNTFGGNPVSCAVGISVLKVIKDEHLQENALEVGNRIKNGLEKLMDKHSLIGDVRGLGLFLGVELVQDRETLVPATEQAFNIMERMKENGILIGIDGPLQNVLKIKPPLVFSEKNADLLVDTLDKILEENDFHF